MGSALVQWILLSNSVSPTLILFDKVSILVLIDLAIG
jgi:hypothetical protein